MQIGADDMSRGLGSAPAMKLALATHANRLLGEHFADLPARFAAPDELVAHAGSVIRTHREEKAARRFRLEEQPDERGRDVGSNRQARPEDSLDVATVARHAATEVPALGQRESAAQERPPRG